MNSPKPRLRRLTLEVSLKPFFDLDDAGIARTCGRIWGNWLRLIDRADAVAVLLWIGSGDEILTWSGDDDDRVPAAQSIGFNNLRCPGAYDPAVEHYTYNAARPYANPLPDLRYRHVRQIIAALKATGEAACGKRPSIGATIDPGPEFADSPWRYEIHPEVLQTKREGLPYPMHFLTHEAALHADARPYAGLPDGIPEGMTLGTLIGRQFEAARRRLGFDFLWLSNGLGYSHHPWIVLGDLFDGRRFHPDRAADALRRANRFWQDLRAETDAPVDVRGTNFTVGMDLATDGCSHADIVRIGRLERPPCNPPWGSRALGLEMAAYLSRLARTPGVRLPMRFYLNDPWFASTPWYDYYGQNPFDIYVPMAASRVSDDGGADAPTDLSLLTIDTSEGDLPEDEAGEVTPHLLAALDARPDAPGPVVWVYPFDEYDALLKERPRGLDRAFAGDWAVARAIDAGLPLSTVCDTGRFARLQAAGRLADAVYVAPVPDQDGPLARALAGHVRGGGSVMLYGSTAGAPADLLAMLALAHAEPVEGPMTLSTTLPGDTFERQAEPPRDVDPLEASVGMEHRAAVTTARIGGQLPLIHRPVTSGGPVVETCTDAAALRAEVESDGRRRAYAVFRADPAWRGGRMAWLRATVDMDVSGPRGEPVWDPPGLTAQPAPLARYLLGEFGVRVLQDRRDEGVLPAHVFFKRCRGAWHVVGVKRDTSVRFRVRLPDGAPVYEEAETPIVGGMAVDGFGKWFAARIAAFVTMGDGIVRTKRQVVPVGLRYHVSIAGLEGADVTLYADAGAAPRDVRVWRELRGGDVPHDADDARGTIRVSGYTGTLYVSW
jgi:hypothetical protein